MTAHSTRTSPPDSELLLEFWAEPTDLAERNLLYGAGGSTTVPDPNARYTFISRDTRGFSHGYDVKDAQGRKWSVKLGPEAKPEVAVSRLLWAAGFHQPPMYYVPHWALSENGRLTPQPDGRFRLDLPHAGKSKPWAWHANPFVGTRPHNGLFVLMVIMNNWDVKTSQNAIYEFETEREGAHRWYVVKDLGASLGKTRWFFPGTRNDLEGFEKEGFIQSVEGERVEFHYRGAWREPHLKRHVTTTDVEWACQRLAALSPSQWRDAFRAAGYTDQEGDRYIRRLQQKVAEGLRLGERQR